MKQDRNTKKRPLEHQDDADSVLPPVSSLSSLAQTPYGSSLGDDFLTGTNVFPMGSRLPGGRLTAEDRTRTLPRNFNVTSMQASSSRRQPIPAFPNPHADTETSAPHALRHTGQRLLRQNDIPPTPPLVKPVSESYPTRQPVVEMDNLDDTDEDDAAETPWSSEDSTPTPTASSVAAASARRKEEAKTMKPVPLMPVRGVTSKVQERPNKAQQVVFHPNKSAVDSSHLRTEKDIAEPKDLAPRKKMSKQPQRPATTSSTHLSNGQEVPTVRTDFSNMKRFSRPASAKHTSGESSVSGKERVKSSNDGDLSNNGETAKGKSIEQPVDKKSKGNLTPVAASPLPPLADLPSAPSIPQNNRFSDPRALSVTSEQIPPQDNISSRGNPLLAVLPREERPVFSRPPPTSSGLSSQPPRMSMVQEEVPEEVAAAVAADKQPVTKEKEAQSMEPKESGHGRRPSNAASLRRSSFGSETTALDTPVIDRTSFEMVTGAEDASSRDVQGKQPRRPLLRDLVAPPSEVPEGAEPASGASEHIQQTLPPPSRNGLSSQIEQLQKFLRPKTGESGTRIAPDRMELPTDPTMRSVQSRVIPITAFGRARPGSRRPETGNSRFSNEYSANGRNLYRPSTRNQRPHEHNSASCRQCFRAGFDCAVQLQTGQGTAARKALHDFVAAGGLEAMSGVEDFYEGSVWGSQAANPRGNNQDGGNFVDRLGEVAFGESALSRPVTRGAVQEMLEERSRFLTEQQHQKTIEDFLLELQRIEKDQQAEEELNNVRPPSQSAHTRSKAGDDHGSQWKQPTASRTKDSTKDTERATQLPSDGGFRTLKEDGPTVLNSHHSQSELRPVDGGESPHSTVTDDLPFLADRWTVVRKYSHLTLCLLFVFAAQCLDSGYVSVCLIDWQQLTSLLDRILPLLRFLTLWAPCHFRCNLVSCPSCSVNPVAWR